MEFNELKGKEVIDKLAHVIGKVSEIVFDVNTWKITHIGVDVDKNIVEILGLKKPMLGSTKATLPVEMIDALSDRILLKNESLDELKQAMKPRLGQI